MTLLSPSARTQTNRALDLALRPHRAKKGYWINASGLAFEGCEH